MENIPVAPKNILFRNLTISSFWLTNWMTNITSEEREKWAKVIYEDIASNGGVFDNPIGKSFKLSEVLNAMTTARKEGSDGKTILRPQE